MRHNPNFSHVDRDLAPRFLFSEATRENALGGRDLPGDHHRTLD